MKVNTRTIDRQIARSLEQAGLAPLLARLFAARGVRSASALNTGLNDLLKPDGLLGLDSAAEQLVGAIGAGQSLCVVGDYDCDGATATALMVSGLRRLGARVDYMVPNRFTDGYGLTPGVVTAALQHPRLGKPDWLITVDNGIASVAGVQAANEVGMAVIVTDHHLPGDTLPAAAAIVNPNQPGCQFASRNLAGVGVAFYVVAAVRARLRETGALPAPPALGDLLDLVALGTIADLVRLDDNNRRLVAAGLARIKAGRARPGIAALCQIAGVVPHQLTVRDLGFALGPRINAAGRLEDISIGIECLLAESLPAALPLAETLDSINRQRRKIEADMRQAALDTITEPTPDQLSLVLHEPDWHEGVVGLVAGRVKERFHRPCFAFAVASGETAEPMLRGSGRSVTGVHLRDALALLDAREPGLIDRFGGHAMAAGLSMKASGLPAFRDGIEKAIAEIAAPGALNPELLTDGPLKAEEMTLTTARTLDQYVWGQGFEAPMFCNEFRVVRQKVVGKGHLKLDLDFDGLPLPAIFFQRDEPLADRARLAYSLQPNEYRGLTTLQLLIHAEAAPD